jgi:hypothetical protein
VTDPLLKALFDLAEIAREGSYTDDEVTLNRAIERIGEYKLAIRKLCSEPEARQVLSPEAAEAIFSEPRSDH